MEWDGTMHNFVGGELSLPVQLGKTKELTIGESLIIIMNMTKKRLMELVQLKIQQI